VREFIPDSRQHRLGLLQDVVVPEADHVQSGRIYGPGSFLVASLVGLLGVLAAVQLDGQLGLVAVEVQDVPAKWMLSAELETAQLLVAEEVPEQLLCVGGLLAHLTGERQQVAGNALTLYPSPIGRGKG
jgi:hypothetical protein